MCELVLAHHCWLVMLLLLAQHLKLLVLLLLLLAQHLKLLCCGCCPQVCPAAT
jgi:hypothetical protein